MLLPQFLAALGAVFALAGVGNQIGHLVTSYMPVDTRFDSVAPRRVECRTTICTTR